MIICEMSLNVCLYTNKMHFIIVNLPRFGFIGLLRLYETIKWLLMLR
jgi:hypothetical protein